MKSCGFYHRHSGLIQQHKGKVLVKETAINDFLYVVTVKSNPCAAKNSKE